MDLVQSVFASELLNIVNMSLPEILWKLVFTMVGGGAGSRSSIAKYNDCVVSSECFVRT